MSTKRKILLAVLVIVGIGIGFFQEYLKINVNYLLETGSGIPGFFELDAESKKGIIEASKNKLVQDFYHKPKTINALYSMSESSLAYSKWALTLGFTIIFLVLNSLILKTFTGKKEVVKWLTYLYLAFFILAFLIFLFGKLTGTLDALYPLSRKITGGLQSMVPLMLMLSAVWISERINLKSQENDIHK